MIVVDSSIWIASLRRIDHPKVRILRRLIEDDGDIIVGDLILLEVLQGARDDLDATRIERALRQFVVAPMLGASMAAQAAANYRRLRALGVTVRRSADMIIGTFCIEGGHWLLHDDRDFAPMQAHLGLLVV